MDLEIKHAIEAADQDAQYDECVKRLLGNKDILSHILVKTVDEFQGMNPKDVIPLIEGEPYIGVVPVEPGLTNAVRRERGQRIVGLGAEQAEIGEGKILFDIICYVRTRDGMSQIIINVEAQKDKPSTYHILNRAIFYASRQISSQKERDFVNSNYDDIKRVFSIWICMNMSQNSMNYVHLTNDALLGSEEWGGKLDLLNIVLVGVSNELPGHNKQYELHRLLGALLSSVLSTEAKLDIISTEYNIPVKDSMRKDVNMMCNLSQGILERGIAQGIEIGKADGIEIGKMDGIKIGKADGIEIGKEGVIINMHKKGYPSEQIAEIVEKDIGEIEVIIRGKALTTS